MASTNFIREKNSRRKLVERKETENLSSSSSTIRWGWHLVIVNPPKEYLLITLNQREYSRKTKDSLILVMLEESWKSLTRKKN